VWLSFLCLKGKGASAVISLSGDGIDSATQVLDADPDCRSLIRLERRGHCMESDITPVVPEGSAIEVQRRHSVGSVLVLLSVLIPLSLAVFMIVYAVMTVINPGPSLTLTGVTPDPLQSGQIATLTARTAPGADCQVQVFYESASMYDTSTPLQQMQQADKSGVVRWRWQVPQGVGVGPADASVTCTIGGATLTSEAAYHVTP
jgi:hypothetical protein